MKKRLLSGKRMVSAGLIFSLFFIEMSIFPACEAQAAGKTDSYTIASINDMPAYAGSSFITVDENEPSFSKDVMNTESFENYSNLDSLGRCQSAFANLCQDLMPTQERGAIGQVKPSGWHTVKYNDIIDGNYLYNRCHLIGYQLAGENANTKNLITGTRWLNVEGMLPFENAVADYIKESDNHVLYRVTPIFEGDNLVASGVEMEAESVEDQGKAISFHVYVYNIQPGITINYADGTSSQDSDYKQEIELAEKNQEILEDNIDTIVTGQTKVVSDISGISVQNNAGSASEKTTAASTEEKQTAAQSESASQHYILNTNTKKFHVQGCKSAKKISSKNAQEYDGSRQELIDMGYEPCKNCNP